MFCTIGISKRAVMFGIFSLPKILFTIVVIVAVWYGFKWLNRRQQVQRDRAKNGRLGEAGGGKNTAVEDMVQCPDCGAYVPEDGRHKCAGPD